MHLLIPLQLGSISLKLFRKHLQFPHFGIDQMRYLQQIFLQFGNYPFLLLDIILSPEQLIFETSDLLKGACFLVIHPSLFFGDIELELSDFLLLRLIELAYLGLKVSDAAALAEDLSFSLSIEESQLFLHSTVLPRKLNYL